MAPMAMELLLPGSDIFDGVPDLLIAVIDSCRLYGRTSVGSGKAFEFVIPFIFEGSETIETS